MQIRTKLTLQFLLIGGAIMIIASCAVYFSSAAFRRDDFYNRMESKARTTARLLIEVEEIDLELLRRIEKDNPVNLPSERIIIYDYNNKVLYSSDEKGEIMPDVRVLNRIRLYQKQTYKFNGYEILGLLYTEEYDRFVVVVAAKDNEGMLKLKNLRIILTVVCLTSICLFSIAGWFYSGRALKPISRVISNVEDISITSLNLRIDDGNGTDELARLARTFNKMLDRLEEAFKIQKEFISNASHEIRTPLTSIYGQLQVLLMKERKADDYKAAISSVVEDIRSLNGLSNSLLLLATTSSEMPEKSFNPVRSDEILWQAAEEAKKINPDYNINISIGSCLSSGDEEKLLIKGNEDLLKVAVANLIDNACKYSDNKTVDIHLECIGESVSFLFSDHGRGISREDLDKIFEPFYRGRDAHTVRGHGIGLSLVQRIVKNHNGTIKVSSVTGMGTSVEILLPVA